MKAKTAAVWWDEARYRDSELRWSVLQGVKMRWGPAGPPPPRWVKGWSCVKDAPFLEQQRSDMFAAGEAFAAPSQDPEKLLVMGAFISSGFVLHKKGKEDRFCCNDVQMNLASKEYQRMRYEPLQAMRHWAEPEMDLWSLDVRKAFKHLHSASRAATFGTTSSTWART